MIEYRAVTSEEYKIIKTQVTKSFNIKEFETIITPSEMIIGIGNWKEVFLVSNQLIGIFHEFKDYRNPYFIGIHFGDINRDKFRISLEGISLISEYVEEKTILNDSGEKKVIYGRDLSKQDIHYIPTHIQKDELSILINEKKEVLALGKYLFKKEEIELLNNTQKIIKNIIDIGWYLRKGR